MNSNEEENQIIAIGDLAKIVGLTTRTLRLRKDIVEYRQRMAAKNSSGSM